MNRPSSKKTVGPFKRLWRFRVATPMQTLLFSSIQLGLSVAMVMLLIRYGLAVGLWSSLGLGFLLLGIGAVSTCLLAYFVPDRHVLWVLLFSFFPACFVPLAAVEFFVEGNGRAAAFWLFYASSVVAATIVGSSLGRHLEYRRRLRRLEQW